jgi:hypothetical protein
MFGNKDNKPSTGCATGLHSRLKAMLIITTNPVHTGQAIPLPPCRNRPFVDEARNAVIVHPPHQHRAETGDETGDSKRSTAGSATAEVAVI